ncbi:MAG: Eco57I restriction-modification methylase domain-containing protein [Bacteroidetes bacterium]|nr:Eco57I restriction-modification methylase domain-containing protein [Bacteroidota bacterium]
MAIFQKSVIKRHLDNLNKEQVEKAFQKFRENYSPAKIEKIKQLKEEEYQDGFLRDLFVDVCGYTLRPDDNYNLVREFKNQGDGKKADGAILNPDSKQGEKAIAVIELKSTKTKDLRSITEQAFNYKNNQPDCKYVITSNFQKLRFYIDYANEYEEFDLFHLDKENFELLYLILHKESVFSNFPLKLKEETKFHEQEVSDKLYKDYSWFKKKLFENLTKNHPESDKLTLFNKSQKLLDRFLFILFAEDSGLLPPNSISRIIDTYHKLTELDAYKPIYDIFKQYFGYMNIGRKGKSSSEDIPAYNGGLFYPDELLNSFKIDDEILIDYLLKLSEYDFNTEVDVNILGHIFEHSLSEIEEITANIEGTTSDKSKSKRKKEGVFYTPKYITQYIVENTIGTLCNEKRKELEIVEIEFDGTYKTKDGKLLAKGKKLYQKLNDYKGWLLSLKIVDPACGSGAFLNQALNFLIEEHKNIDDIIAELTGTSLRLFDTENSILERNLYGVDINEESVEIAKLSLWLRTAQKDRKLSNLNNNIKCGNSLIDDPDVAGDKAFDWNKEFPQVYTVKEKKAWHVTFVLHNSRYSDKTDGLTRQFSPGSTRQFSPGSTEYIEPGFIAYTHTDLSEDEEIILAEELVKSAAEYNLNILECNICADHVHSIIVCEEDKLSTLIGKWKGRTAFTYNRRVYPLIDKEEAQYSDGTKEKFWAKSFNSKLIDNKAQLENTINYIRNNRQKHELPKATDGLTRQLNKIRCTYSHAYRKEYNGGFDVVIGNPPYVKEYTNRQAFDGLHKHYCYQGKMDLWYFFGALALEIIKKEKGLIGYIAPNNWITNSGASKFRNIVINKGKIIEYIDFGDFKVFDSAGIQTMIYIMKRSDNNKKYDFDYAKVIDSKIKHIDAQLFLENVKDERFEYFTTEIEKDKYVDKPINFINTGLTIIVNKIKLKQDFVFDNKEIATGIDVHQDFINKKHIDILGEDYKVGEGIFNLSHQEYNTLNLIPKEKELVKPFFTTSELGRFYGIPKNTLWVIYTNSSFKNPETIESYPNLKRHLDRFAEIITSDNKPYGLHRAREEKFFLGKKIISVRKCARPTFTFTDFDCYVSQTYFSIKTERLNQKYLTGLLNSNPIAFWLKYKGKMQGDLYQVDKEPLLNLPIIKPSNETQTEISELVTRIIEQKQKQIDYSKLLEKTKVENNFEREIQLEKELEGMAKTIESAENLINELVYNLYGLTEEEIRIVEGNVK